MKDIAALIVCHNGGASHPSTVLVCDISSDIGMATTKLQTGGVQSVHLRGSSTWWGGGAAASPSFLMKPHPHSDTLLILYSSFTHMHTYTFNLMPAHACRSILFHPGEAAAS